MDLELAVFVWWKQVGAEDVRDFAGDRIFCSKLADRRTRKSSLVTYGWEDAIQESRARWPRSGSSSRAVRRQRKEAEFGKEREVDVTRTIQTATSMATTCLVHPLIFTISLLRNTMV